jgi:hypothetical protein
MVNVPCQNAADSIGADYAQEYVIVIPMPGETGQHSAAAETRSDTEQKNQSQKNCFRR